MPLQLPALPVLEALPKLRTALSGAGVAVLAAPPGSGKTTLIPLALLDEPWLRGRRILMLEPRRIAARAAAARMSFLLGSAIGETVGYQIRFERKISTATRIEVITEGLLTRRLQADPELPGVGLVIFDEFHERSLDADLALALTLDARAQLNPELRLLVMSATLDTGRVAKLLGDAPVVEAAGRMFPIEVRYRPQPPGGDVASGVLAAYTETAGDVLVFLPGGREIRQCQRRLQDRLGTQANVLPLYGELSSAEQDAALTPARDGRRKIILATNIAQTSLTVEGVTTVVDGGEVRVARYDLGSGANRLETERVSRASAEQRSGRAGRLGPGTAYRLWSAEQQGRLPAHDTPEILAADLSRFALELAQWGVADPAALSLLDLPSPVAWQAARKLLLDIDAIGAGGRITPHGRELARLPTPPRRGHMLLAARSLDLTVAAAWTAAALDLRDGSAGIDLAARVRAYSEGRAPDANAQRQVRETARQLLRLIDAPDRGGVDEAAVGRVIALAYPERIARRRAQQRGVYLCADGSEARVHETEALAQAEWLAIAHWDPGPPRRVRAAAVLSESQLLADQAGRLQWHRVVEWNPQAEAVTSEEQRRLGALVLERRLLRDPGEDGRAAMLEGLRSLGLHSLPWTDAARDWQARVESLRAWRPSEAWPDVSDPALLAQLEDWLGPQLDGIVRRDHLARLNLLEILQQRLDYAARQQLARLAPTQLSVPSGTRVALAYAPPGPPVLAVKLQELFGLEATPAVNDGRMPVMLHLLSPGRRPIQVTQDLAGFWTRTYPEVRKELKGRYPRHPWPDDPLAALSTARAKPRGS